MAKEINNFSKYQKRLVEKAKPKSKYSDGTPKTPYSPSLSCDLEVDLGEIPNNDNAGVFEPWLRPNPNELRNIVYRYNPFTFGNSAEIAPLSEAVEIACPKCQEWEVDACSNKLQCKLCNYIWEE